MSGWTFGDALAAFSRRHAGHDIGAILAHQAGAGPTLPAGDSLHQDAFFSSIRIAI